MHWLSSVAEQTPVDVEALLLEEVLVEDELLLETDEDEVVDLLLEELVVDFDEEELVYPEAYKTRKLRATTVKMVLI